MCLPDQDAGDVGDEIARTQISVVRKWPIGWASRYLGPGCIDDALLTCHPDHNHTARAGPSMVFIEHTLLSIA
jgi:hypothetical protein